MVLLYDKVKYLGALQVSEMWVLDSWQLSDHVEKLSKIFGGFKKKIDVWELLKGVDIIQVLHNSDKNSGYFI
jgi:hypothetical protein